MATKKKAKAKATKKKKAKAPKAAVRKKAVPKKVAAKKKTAARAKAAPKAKAKPRKPAVTPPPAAPVAPTGMERIGVVTHYYNHLSVAILKLEKGILRVGDHIHIKGHTSDFAQPVDSMEIEHAHVNEARPGQSFGLRVREHAREHDVVYKAKS
jgi:putative protease